MIEQPDRPLITLEMVRGYPYPLPPKTRLRSLDPATHIMTSSRFTILHWSQNQLDGTPKIWETVARPPAALVIPVDSEGRVMLVKTTQPHATYDGFIAGDIDPGKDRDLFTAARRELLEEVGYFAKTFHVVYFHYFVAGQEWFAYTIIAEGCEKACEPILDPGEKCEPYYVSVDQLIDMTRAKKFRFPPVLVTDLLVSQDEEKLHRIFKNPRLFSAMSFG